MLVIAKASLRYKNRDRDEIISSRRELEFSLSAIRGFNRDIVNSINALVKDNDIYDRLALLIIKEGYRGVFIAREN